MAPFQRALVLIALHTAIDWYMRRKTNSRPISQKEEGTIGTDFMEGHFSKELTLNQFVYLRCILQEAFNESELCDLSFDLGVDYDSLSGVNKNDKARELILLHKRQRRLPLLIEILKHKRPFLFD